MHRRAACANGSRRPLKAPARWGRSREFIRKEAPVGDIRPVAIDGDGRSERIRVVQRGGRPLAVAVGRRVAQATRRDHVVSAPRIDPDSEISARFLVHQTWFRPRRLPRRSGGRRLRLRRRGECRQGARRPRGPRDRPESTGCRGRARRAGGSDRRIRPGVEQRRREHRRGDRRRPRQPRDRGVHGQRLQRPDQRDVRSSQPGRHLR